MIIVFDAKCLVCSAWVKFLLKYDRMKVFRFASIQGDAGKALVAKQSLDVSNLDTMLLIDGTNVYENTDAIIRVLYALGGAWRVFSVGRLIPPFFRDGAYRFVARNRYRLLGVNEMCFLPDEMDKNRFLD